MDKANSVFINSSIVKKNDGLTQRHNCKKPTIGIYKEIVKNRIQSYITNEGLCGQAVETVKGLSESNKLLHIGIAAMYVQHENTSMQLYGVDLG